MRFDTPWYAAPLMLAMGIFLVWTAQVLYKDSKEWYYRMRRYMYIGLGALFFLLAWFSFITWIVS